MPSLSPAIIFRQLNIKESGLNSSEIEALRTQHGYNELPAKKRSILRLIANQFEDIMIYILVGAAVVSFLAPLIQTGHVERSEFINAAAIMAIVLLNAALGFAQEWRAENAIALLKKLSAPHARVRRDGIISVIPSRELLPGDIMFVEAGDRISADVRITESSSLETDESSLTGESVPSSKIAVAELSAASSGTGEMFAGTLVTRGSGSGIVTGIGLSTEIGKIASMVSSLESPPTPLELQLKDAGKRIGILVLALCAVIFALGVYSGIPAAEMFFTAVSLAVAAVPEGLPAIVTICLAIGVQRMIKRNALIRRLDAVETLGNVTIICADKTGTITMNRMTVESIWISEGGDKKLAIEIAASCNRAELPNIGDPTEVALLVRAQADGVKRLPITEEEVPFTSEGKYMVTLHQKGNETVRYIKGAPEVVAKFFDDASRREVLAESERCAAKGLRMLAVAYGPEDKCISAGLIALIDPPRAEAKEAIANARTAGIRTLMITGDHPATALAIANTVGIVTERVIDGVELEAMDTEELIHALKTVSVFARVRPAHKVKILEALQSLNHIVAMSGDGVNDAPALKRAHVGVAMGKIGTDIAREASAMVLTDDNYATIVAAISEGRRIYDNIRKFVLFLLRCNVGEVMMIAGAMLFGMPLPLLPLHILWINLVTDSFPALALSMEPAEKGIMNRPPRKRTEGIFTGEWFLFLVAGLINAGLSLSVFALTHRSSGDLALARTATLTATILFQLLLAVATRTTGSAFSATLFQNRWLLGAIALSVGLHVLLLVTPLNLIIPAVTLPWLLWDEIALAAFAGFVLFEAAKFANRRLFVR